ncbi:FimB/Mfa2 family fimbrial subunit [Parabacteroides gordonii]|uniref:FimB/Mfa2 family fimbrial subunit n=1 Tax=Parabacteroides gordonii TaxID=574930 RepID=UPI0026EB0487|nr:FimB/Mfa2 family fimbrial subunit [Parabacteroides gordonii]
MGRIVYFLHAIGMLFLLSSCIKEDMDDCVITHTVKVYVKDKNYSNIESVFQLVKKDEKLPYRAFISTVHYQLRDIKTGQIVEEKSDNALSGSDQFYTIQFNNLPQGDYNLTVWGNIQSDTATGILHNNGNELTDTYVANKNITFTSEPFSDLLMLERAKGDLLLLCSNFPSEITLVEEKVTSLYDTVDPYLKYTGNTTVHKTGPVKPLIETVLAPSVAGGSSKLHLRFFSGTSGNASKELVVPEIPLIMNRNQVTAVEVNYNKITDVLEIWTYVDGEWTMIHHLDILNTK